MTITLAPKPQPIWEKYTESQLINAAHLMIGRGGSFASCIGEAYFHSDSHNKEILLRGFADLFERFVELSKDA